MQRITDSELMSINGGGFMRNIIDHIRFGIYVIYEYFYYKKRDRASGLR